MRSSHARIAKRARSFIDNEASVDGSDEDEGRSLCCLEDLGCKSRMRICMFLIRDVTQDIKAFAYFSVVLILYSMHYLRN